MAAVSQVGGSSRLSGVFQQHDDAEEDEDASEKVFQAAKKGLFGVLVRNDPAAFLA